MRDVLPGCFPPVWGATEYKAIARIILSYMRGGLNATLDPVLGQET
jgi:hypothetical protein